MTLGFWSKQLELLCTKILIKAIPGRGEGLDSEIWFLNMRCLININTEMSNSESDICVWRTRKTPSGKIKF